ncbi:MAG: GNAT family N-acetyltransferase [Deltaproteobacteria bacterium]|nr:MAG: GNAT family N-acetyltransferase [Deltaproteobacteria bacterium]
MNLDWPALETERLILRPWKPEDFEPYARFSADEESMRYLGRDGRPTDAAETWRTICLFIGHWYLRGYTFWAVEEKATGEFVGRVGPWKPEGWPDLEIGWAVDRSRWGRGYATEAARAAADWVHRTLGADHVVHLIHEQNVRSIRVAEKLGAKRDGTCTLFGTIDVLVYRTGLPLAPSASAVAG